MRGRILRVKKSAWLIISFVCNLIAFLAFSLVSVLMLKDIDAVFFLFCFFTGIHQIVKGFMFKLDSSCYLGHILFFIGCFYFLCLGLSIKWVYPVFIVLAFAFSSFIVGVMFREPFQLFLSLSLLFVGISLLLFLMKLISIWIFVAIILLSMLLLFIRFLKI